MHRSIAALALLVALATPAPAHASRGYGQPVSSPVPAASPRPTPTAAPEPVRPSATISAPSAAPSTVSRSSATTLPATGTASTWLVVFLGCMLVLCGCVIIALLGMATARPLRPKRRYASRHAGGRK